LTPITATTTLLLGNPLAKTVGMANPDKPIPAVANPVFLRKFRLFMNYFDIFFTGPKKHT